VSGLIGALVLVGGLALIVWGAERFTDGALRAASRFAVSAFYVGAVVSGFEPENLVTGAAAAVAHLPQIALGTVIGSAVFLLTAALGLTLLLVPLPVAAPRAGPIAMLMIVALSAGAIWADGAVTRTEGSLLVLAALGLMTWLYRRSVVFRPKTEAERAPAHVKGRPRRGRSSVSWWPARGRCYSAPSWSCGARAVSSALRGSRRRSSAWSSSARGRA